VTRIVDDVGFAFPEIAETDVRDEVEFNERFIAPVDHGDGELCCRHYVALIATSSGSRFLKHDAACETAFRDPRSFVHRYSQLSEDAARSIAEGLWRNINLSNLNENMLPTRPRADLILSKGSDHLIEEVRTQEDMKRGRGNPAASEIGAGEFDDFVADLSMMTCAMPELHAYLEDSR
jgi:hypothetical protein